MAIRLWNIANPVDSSIIEETALVHNNATLALPSITVPDFLLILCARLCSDTQARCSMCDYRREIESWLRAVRTDL
jgi:hypothetical protein